MSWSKWLKFDARGVEVAAVCLSVPAACLSVFQAWSAGEDAQKAEVARSAAERQANAAERQVAIAERQAIAARAQADYAKKLADVQGHHLDVAKSELNAAVRIASATEQSAALGREQIRAAAKNVAAEIDAANEREWQFRRARISVVALDMENFVVGKKPQARLTMQNMGPTSAININVWHDWIVQHVDAQLPDTPSCDQLPGNATITVSGSRTFTLTRSSPWTQEEHEALSRSNPATVIGSICYEDERHQGYQTTFCRFATGEGGVTICDVGERERKR